MLLHAQQTCMSTTYVSILSVSTLDLFTINSVLVINITHAYILFFSLTYKLIGVLNNILMSKSGLRNGEQDDNNCNN